MSALSIGQADFFCAPENENNSQFVRLLCGFLSVIVGSSSGRSEKPMEQPVPLVHCASVRPSDCRQYGRSSRARFGLVKKTVPDPCGNVKPSENTDLLKRRIQSGACCGLPAKKVHQVKPCMDKHDKKRRLRSNCVRNVTR